ncbi:MAG: T9SS type A sorting domain-containing protein [bacterium]|nr:T9SS type A sorting domain-containing protein [bacterium]
MAFNGFAGQPTLGTGTLAESGTMISTTYIRAVRQYLYSPPINSDQPIALPARFELGQNFPNPFNPSTVIPFALDKSAQGQIAIYNLTGQIVRSFDLHGYAAGEYQLVWDGKNSNGFAVPSGQYFARLSHDARVQVRKLTLIK